jgi:hypothetical protein
MNIVVPIVIVGGVAVCWQVFAQTREVPWPFRILLIVLYGLLVVAWSIGAYVHTGPIAVVIFILGFIFVLGLGMISSSPRR